MRKLLVTAIAAVAIVGVSAPVFAQGNRNLRRAVNESINRQNRELARTQRELTDLFNDQAAIFRRAGRPQLAQRARQQGRLVNRQFNAARQTQRNRNRALNRRINQNNRAFNRNNRALGSVRFNRDLIQLRGLDTRLIAGGRFGLLGNNRFADRLLLEDLLLSPRGFGNVVGARGLLLDPRFGGNLRAADRRLNRQLQRAINGRRADIRRVNRRLNNRQFNNRRFNNRRISQRDLRVLLGGGRRSLGLRGVDSRLLVLGGVGGFSRFDRFNRFDTRGLLVGGRRGISRFDSRRLRLGSRRGFGRFDSRRLLVGSRRGFSRFNRFDSRRVVLIGGVRGFDRFSRRGAFGRSSLFGRRNSLRFSGLRFGRSFSSRGLLRGRRLSSRAFFAPRSIVRTGLVRSSLIRRSISERIAGERLIRSGARRISLGDSLVRRSVLRGGIF